MEFCLEDESIKDFPDRVNEFLQRENNAIHLLHLTKLNDGNAPSFLAIEPSSGDLFENKMSFDIALFEMKSPENSFFVSSKKGKLCFGKPQFIRGTKLSTAQFKGASIIAHHFLRDASNAGQQPVILYEIDIDDEVKQTHNFSSYNSMKTFVINLSK